VDTTHIFHFQPYIFFLDESFEVNSGPLLLLIVVYLSDGVQCTFIKNKGSACLQQLSDKSLTAAEAILESLTIKLEDSSSAAGMSSL
jgi:hypothetical protein